MEWVTNEEDWEVQADEIVVSVLCVELDGVSSRISSFIGVFSAVGDGRESTEDGGLLADGGEEGCLGEVADVFGYDEFTECGPSTGMNDSFLNFGSIEGLRATLVLNYSGEAVVLACCFSNNMVSP